MPTKVCLADGKIQFSSSDAYMFMSFSQQVSCTLPSPSGGKLIPTRKRLVVNTSIAGYLGRAKWA
jgi:hypothetical protein